MIDQVKFINLEMNEDEKKIIEEDKVFYKKNINKVISKSRQSSKGEKCMICNKEVTSFCNSHSIPAFCLRNIAKDGKVYHSNKVVELPFLDFEKGIKNAGTFQLICNDCDNTIFQDYENPQNYTEKISGQMLAQIVLKNSLKLISKRSIELEMPNSVRELGSYYPSVIENMYSEVKHLDLEEEKMTFEKAKRLAKKKDNDDYYLFFYKKLDYKVPVAFQGGAALVTDLDGLLINNIYNKDPNYKISYLYICIFPLEEETVILLFIDSKDKRYRRFYKKFNGLPLDTQLSIINYIIFLYTEDYFISSHIDKSVLENENLKSVASNLAEALVLNSEYNPIQDAKNYYDLSNPIDIPNLLSKKYAL